MARDGSGNYSRPVTPPVNGDVANATDYNSEQNDIATALSDSINKAGTKAFAANQPCGGFIFTGLGAGANNGESVRFEQLASSIAAAVGVTVQGLDATLTALAALSWSSGNALLQFTAADTVSLTLTPSVTSLTLSGVLSAPAGSAAAPSVKVGAEQNGLCSLGANDLTLVTAGVGRWSLSSNSFFPVSTTLGKLYAGDCTAGAPGLSFINDTDCGFYRIGANNIGFSLNGALNVDFSTTRTLFSSPVQARVALSTETTGTLTSASANRKVVCTGNITLDDGVFTADDFQLFDPGTSARTFTRAAGLTMYVNGTDSASATLAANQMGASHWRSASVVVLTGAFT